MMVGAPLAAAAAFLSFVELVFLVPLTLSRLVSSFDSFSPPFINAVSCGPQKSLCQYCSHCAH